MTIFMWKSEYNWDVGHRKREGSSLSAIAHASRIPILSHATQHWTTGRRSGTIPLQVHGESSKAASFICPVLRHYRWGLHYYDLTTMYVIVLYRPSRTAPTHQCSSVIFPPSRKGTSPHQKNWSSLGTLITYITRLPMISWQHVLTHHFCTHYDPACQGIHTHTHTCGHRLDLCVTGTCVIHLSLTSPCSILEAVDQSKHMSDKHTGHPCSPEKLHLL